MGARTGGEAVKAPLRGQVFKLRTGATSTPAVVVSNDLRNATLPTVLLARVTAAPRPAVATIVELPVGEPVAGRVLCDNIAEIPTTTLGRSVGALSRRTMERVDAALRVALQLDAVP